MTKKILIITATSKEKDALDLPKNCITHVCGIGLANSSSESMWAIEHHKPCLVIMVGIAGKYAHSNLQIGESVLVESELTSDCGAFYGDEFRSTFAQEYLCPFVKNYSFKTVKSATVNVCAAPFITPQAEIENMEGAGFFASATKLRVPFLELRTISNTVSATREDWDMDLALKNMNLALKKLLDEIKA
ncbi:MAG: hypothetical protein R3Y38_02110 [Rikenellaceae bacterium]